MVSSDSGRQVSAIICYCQIEKEVQSELFGLTKFGRHFKVVTDHKPLEKALEIQIHACVQSWYPNSRLRSPISSTNRLWEWSLAVNNVTLNEDPRRWHALWWTHVPASSREDVKEKAHASYTASTLCLIFFRVLHTIFSHLRAHALARSVTVARSSAVQASSSRRQERRWAIVCGSPQSQSTDSTRFQICNSTTTFTLCLMSERDLILWPHMSTDSRHYATCVAYADKLTYSHWLQPKYHHYPGEIRRGLMRSNLLFCDNWLLLVSSSLTTFQTPVLKWLPESWRTISTHGILRQWLTVLIGRVQQVFFPESTSPGNSQANGATEAAVKTAKRHRKNKAGRSLTRACELQDEAAYLLWLGRKKYHFICAHNIMYTYTCNKADDKTQVPVIICTITV